VVTNNAYNSKHIVENVTYWSTERTAEDIIQIWALGKAGWYLLEPAPEYKAVYDQMKESGRLWHFISDKYIGRITKKLRDEDMEVVRREAAEEESELGSSSSIMQLFNKHRRFLIMRMLDERKKYHQTPLWKYYMKNYRVCAMNWVFDSLNVTDLWVERCRRCRTTGQNWAVNHTIQYNQNKIGITCK